MKNGSTHLDQSNYWYNDALAKAKERNLTGAIASARKSLQYNRRNADARNLLGLCLYGRGDVMEALTQWILSKNFLTVNNLADEYIQKVCGNNRELSKLNQAAALYNRGLQSARRKNLAEAQQYVEQALENNPEHVKAYQLGALIAIQNEEESVARKMIHQAYRLDKTDPITLRYLHELDVREKEKNVAVRTNEKRGKHALSYMVGNDTIIQPINRRKKANTRMQNLMNLVVGLLVGLVATWFLIVPAIDSARQKEQNKAVVEFSDQIATQEAQISALRQELDDYRKASEGAENEETTAAGTMDSYEIILNIYPHYQRDDMSDAAMVEELLKVNAASLGSVGKSEFEEMTGVLYQRYGSTLYEGAQANYEVANYEAAVEKMDVLLKMNEGYDNGGALLLMAKIHEAQGEQDKANLKYQKILNEYPETTAANQAKEAIDAQNTDSNGDGTGDGTGADGTVDGTETEPGAGDDQPVTGE